jgi:hypothetical protein
MDVAALHFGQTGRDFGKPDLWRRGGRRIVMQSPLTIKPDF